MNGKLKIPGFTSVISVSSVAEVLGIELISMANVSVVTSIPITS